LRILLLNQFYPPDTAPTGQYLADLARRLVAGGHDVHVMSSQRAYGGGAARFPRQQMLDGVHVHRIGASGFGRGNTLGRLADYVSFYFLAGVRALRLPRMDVCVCLTTPPFIALVGDLLKWLRGTSLVHWTMDLYPQVLSAFGVLSERHWLYRLLGRLARRLYRRSDAIISLGDMMTCRLQDAGAAADRIHTIHNWVPGEVVRPLVDGRTSLRDEWGLTGKTVLMYSGNLGFGHELDTVVHAIAQIDGLSDLETVFVGQAKMRRPLEQLVDELGLKSVCFRPRQPLARLGETLATGDIQLISQRPGTEGLIVPSKLYGILAAARPVIYVGPDNTEVGQAIQQSQSGLVVRNGDVEALAAALQLLAADPSRRRQMGQRGRAFYLEHFGRDRSVERMVQVVEGVSPRAKRSATT